MVNITKRFRLLYLALLLALVFCLPACQEAAGDGVEGDEAVVDAPKEANAEAEVDVMQKDLTALELARLMGYGINLGNTMEACNSDDRIPNRDPVVYETMWGQPVTTQEMVTGMKAAGFATLRIPVAWTNAMDFENADYVINSAYLERVAEIVDYALNEDMYVIINDHWDHGWWSMFSHPEQEARDKARTIFTEMWQQIAEYFKDYDVRLIFEPANEEWGNRFNDRTPFNPTGGSLSKDECHQLLTELAQVFVDLVRDAGGNNATRFLLIPGYNTDVAETVDERFRMPTDRVENRLLLSVHYYTPWSYCGDTSGIGSWGRTSEVEEMNRLLGLLTKYTEMGYGIVLGEWGVLDNEGDDRLTFFTNFLDNCDQYGYVPLLWDTGSVYNRAAARIAPAELAELFASRSREARTALTTEQIVASASESMALILQKSAERVETVVTADEAFAWIMFASGDWSTQYSVGDQYKPEDITPGVVATDAEVTAGAGTYTVALDFTGTAAGYADGMEFSAVGIINGEILFPGYYMQIVEVLINGEKARILGRAYTTNDNWVTTRVNLYNKWVSAIPVETARIYGARDLLGASAVILQNYIAERIETLEVTFEYIAP
jgi:endoglucanase